MSSSCPLEIAAALQSLSICRPMVSKVTVTTSSSHPQPEQVPFSGWAVLTIIGQELILFQLNVEGISKAKLEIISHLATENKAVTIFLQETHATRPDVLTTRATLLLHISSATATALPHSSLIQSSGTR